jgi:hypothetical protein
LHHQAEQRNARKDGFVLHVTVLQHLNSKIIEVLLVDIELHQLKVSKKDVLNVNLSPRQHCDAVGDKTAA